MVASDVFLSVVCTVQSAQDWLEPRLTGLSRVLNENFQYYEILVIDNASTDRTAAIVKDILKREKNIQYCVLSTRESESVALTAGLDRAIGDFVVLMDLAVDPPEIIPKMLALATAGAEIVYGLPRERVKGHGLYNRFARLFLKFIARFNDIDIPQGTSTYRMFSRSVLNYILEASDHHRTLALGPAFSGYGYSSIEYERAGPNPSDPRTVGRQALYRALDLMFSTSVRPLRIVTVMCLGISMLTVFYAIYVVIARLVIEDVAPGWATLSLQVSVLFFLVSIVLAVMCEYVLQVFETTNRRPIYHIAREIHSSTMDYRQDLNVIETGGSLAGRRRLERAGG